MPERMRIGEVAERAEVTPRTIRYYESIGLLPAGEREGQGQHYYTLETVARLRKIDQLKRLGLGLDEIGQVIELYFSDPSGVQPKRQVLALLRRHRDDADRQIAALQQFRADLQAHIDRFEHWFAQPERP